MNWIEIIKVRAADTREQQTISDMIESFCKGYEGTTPVAVRIYRHATVESDLSIHIHWSSKTISPRKSSMGLMVADCAGTLGSVNHSIWVEKERGTVEPS